MILIIGSSNDDVLYFQRVLNNKRSEMILNRFQAAIGTYFNQEAMVISGIYSSLLASSVLSHIMNNYYLDLVIAVGKCYSIDENTKNGDIVISSRIVNVNADFSAIKENAFGEIPGLNRDYLVQKDIIRYLTEGMNKRSSVNSYQAVFFSSDILSPDLRNMVSTNRSAFGISDERIVLDQNSTGLALACQLKDVPFIAAKVVESRFDANYKVDFYLKVLEKYIDLGKAVLSTIGDIGRNDILRGGVGNEYSE